VTHLAEAGGVVGSLGLFTLMLANSRGARVAGFWGWAAGCGALAA
jgi:hypothetical protein